MRALEKLNQIEDIVVNQYAEDDEPFSEIDLRVILNRICSVLDNGNSKLPVHKRKTFTPK